jgi:hypothetical protein
MNEIVPFQSIGRLSLGVPKTQIDGILGFVKGEEGGYVPEGVVVAKYKDGTIVEYLDGLSVFIGVLAQSQPTCKDFNFCGSDRERVEIYFKKAEGLLYYDFSMLVSGAFGITCYSSNYIDQITEGMNVLSIGKA